MKTNASKSAVQSFAKIGRWIAPVAATMLSGAAFAQYAQPVYVPSPQTAAPAYVPSPAYRLSDAQLDQLTGPIALYPDPLIAEILPAATYPSEVQSAAGMVQSGVPAQEAIDAQPWEGSVKALVHYPLVLQMMGSRMDWTQQLGSAYLNQPDDVMNSIQRLRAIAQGDGALYSSPQEQVVTSDNLISIVPANPDVIYVPEYDPGVVFVSGRNVDRDVIRFGPEYHSGAWLNYDTDWNHHYIVEGRRWDQREHVDVGRDVHAGARPSAQAEPHRWVRNEAKPLPAHVEAGREEHRDVNVREEQARPAAHAEGPAADVNRQAEIQQQLDEHRNEPAARPAEPPRPEANREARQEPARAEAQQSREQEARQQQAHEPQARDQQAHEQPAREQQAHEQQAREQQAHDQQAREQQAHEQQAREQQAHEQQAREQQAHEQQAHPQPAAHSEPAHADNHDNADSHDNRDNRR